MGAGNRLANSQSSATRQSGWPSPAMAHYCRDRSRFEARQDPSPAGTIRVYLASGAGARQVAGGMGLRESKRPRTANGSATVSRTLPELQGHTGRCGINQVDLADTPRNPVKYLQVVRNSSGATAPTPTGS
jgi:hypothetical protein